MILTGSGQTPMVSNSSSARSSSLSWSRKLPPAISAPALFLGHQTLGTGDLDAHFEAVALFAQGLVSLDLGEVGLGEFVGGIEVAHQGGDPVVGFGEASERHIIANALQIGKEYTLGH